MNYTVEQFRWRQAIGSALAQVGVDSLGLPWQQCDECGCWWGQVAGVPPFAVDTLNRSVEVAPAFDRAVELAAPLLAGDVHEFCNKRW